MKSDTSREIKSIQIAPQIGPDFKLQKFEKGNEINLEEHPEKERPLTAENLEFTLGDLHGNALKLLYFLVRYGVFEIQKDDYNAFVEIYKKQVHELTNNDLTKFKKILSNITVNKDSSKVRLIGDVLSDRGSNDYFTLKILEKLRTNNVNVEILFSNHDYDLLHKLEHKKNFLYCSRPDKDGIGNPASILWEFTTSMHNMLFLFKGDRKYYISKNTLEFYEYVKDQNPFIFEKRGEDWFIHGQNNRNEHFNEKIQNKYSDFLNKLASTALGERNWGRISSNAERLQLQEIAKEHDGRTHLIDAKEVINLINSYYTPTLKAISYTLNNDGGITLYSHAPINLGIVRDLAEELGVKYDDRDRAKLAETIDQVNKEFQLLVKNGGITAKTDLKEHQANNPDLDCLNNALQKIIWNRDNYRITKPEANNNGYSIRWAHGHIGPSRGINNAAKYKNYMYNLDNGALGRPKHLKGTCQIFHSAYSKVQPDIRLVSNIPAQKTGGIINQEKDSPLRLNTNNKSKKTQCHGERIAFVMALGTLGLATTVYNFAADVNENKLGVKNIGLLALNLLTFGVQATASRGYKIVKKARHGHSFSPTLFPKNEPTNEKEMLPLLPPIVNDYKHYTEL